MTGVSTLGKLLRERRLDLKGQPDYLSQARMALALRQMGHKISQGQLSYIENDTASIRSLDPEGRLELLRLYQYNLNEIREINARFSLGIPPYLLGEHHSTDLRPVGRVAPILDLGAVSAGLDDIEGGSDTYIDTPIDFLQGSKPENCFWLTVSGDSMACDDVRLSIPEGSRCLFDRTMEPRKGKIITCLLEKNGQRTRVLKIYGREDRYLILKSYNAEHEDILLTEGDSCTYLGTYIGKWEPAP